MGGSVSQVPVQNLTDESHYKPNFSNVTLSQGSVSQANTKRCMTKSATDVSICGSHYPDTDITNVSVRVSQIQTMGFIERYSSSVSGDSNSALSEASR